MLPHIIAALTGFRRSASLFLLCFVTNIPEIPTIKGHKLVHGWDRITNLKFYSLLALSTHKNVKCYPTMTKYGLVSSALGDPKTLLPESSIR